MKGEWRSELRGKGIWAGGLERFIAAFAKTQASMKGDGISWGLRLNPLTAGEGPLGLAWKPGVIPPELDDRGTDRATPFLSARRLGERRLQRGRDVGRDEVLHIAPEFRDLFDERGTRITELLIRHHKQSFQLGL